ncbi:alpha/beta hydrolase [Rhodosalinus sediminis]|uniref:Alpha/beta hydrolase n=1 Tax=Rhodosalinus sediminis TaxID=1940533 RepID=A0A3D9BZ03_9RHOB|nr:alpha/beta hydrolase [Rhodosalinus sediminis]REC58734.1 alpha/beta hydrolase [Rhodosalinus sediminis]
MSQELRCPETRAGAGPAPAAGPRGPVVLLHGLLESPALWAPLREALGLEAVLAPPLPGHRADAPRLPGAAALLAQPAALARHMANVIEAESGGRPVQLIGHSLGGYLALLIARERPDLVSRALVVGAIHAGDCGKRATLRVRVATGMPLVGPLSAQVLIRHWLADADRFAAWMTASLAPGERLEAVPPAMRRDLAGGDPATIRALAVWARGQSALDSFARLATPVTVVICRRDPVVTVAHQLELARALPAGVAQLTDTGHLPMLTAQRRFARTVRAWLDADTLHAAPAATEAAPA